MHSLKFIKFQVLLALCFNCLGTASYARPYGGPGQPPRAEPVYCSKGYWAGVNCNNNNYNVCYSNSNNQINEANKNLSSLKEEKILTPSKMNFCMKEVVLLIKDESEKKTSLVRTISKVDNFKNNILQVGRIQKMQETYFNALGLEINKLDMALPEIAVRLNDLIINQNIKVDLILADFVSQLESARDQDEIDKIEMEIEIFKDLKIIQSKILSNDPLAFSNLIHDALYGQGDKKIKAINAFDPLTYLVLKTVLDSRLTSLKNAGLNDLEEQMMAIKSDMRIFVSKQKSDLLLEEQMLIQDNYNLEEASKNRSYKENECAHFDQRNDILPQLINEASVTVGTTSALLSSCNSFCTNTWVPEQCFSK